MRRNQSSWTPRREKRALKERQSSCTPTEIIETVPTCAISCVESFIATEYSTSCANTSSLTFLCVTPNPSGFALGEAALQCMVSNCASTSSEAAVYNICAGIMGSVPETIATITATLAPMTAVTSTTLPPSIAKPSTTPAWSTLATATGSPSVVTPAPSAPVPPTSAATAVSTIRSTSLSGTVSSTASSTIRANPEATTSAAAVARLQGTALSTGAIAGIAIGGVAAIAGILSVLFFLLCFRKKSRSKRPISQRWSIGAFPPPPPGKDAEKAADVPAPSFTPNQRFYAAAAPEEKRRSFWRKSINPVDIGVAVSPGRIVEASPAISEKSASGLLVNSEGPSMWPAPLMSFPLPPKGVPVRPGHAVPVIDEQRSNGSFNSNPTFSMHAPYETRLSQPPQQLTQMSYSRPLNSVPGSSTQPDYETRLGGLPQQTTNARAGATVYGSVPSYSLPAPYETRLSVLPQKSSANTEPTFSGPVPTFGLTAPYETRLSTIPQQTTTARAGATVYGSVPSYGLPAPYETRLSVLPQISSANTEPTFSGPVPTFGLTAPYETRLSTIPQQTTSTRAGPPNNDTENQAYNAERARGAAITGRIPLTPIYDNGTFANPSQGARVAPVAYRWDTPESMNQVSRPVLAATVRPPMGLNISNATFGDAQNRKIAEHTSMASDSTTFEEETTPEEERDRQLRLAQSRSLGQYTNEVLARIPEGDVSPIKNLTYPEVPRPAVVSRQAQQVPRPLAGQGVNTTDSRPAELSRGLSRRLEMRRAGQSYLQSESSSSSSGPSLLAQRRSQQKDLRIKTPNAAANSLNSRWQVSIQPIPGPPIPRKELPARMLQARPSLKDASPKARVTPKTNSRGDLYLTVED